jgi:plasmid stabilization system protein ParE
MDVVIKWNKNALIQLVKAIDYIELDSIQNAAVVKTAIFAAIENLKKQPEKYSPDKYKLNNDGSFRAFELHHYRISYRCFENEIRIIRIRHTKRNPQVF